VANEWLYGSSVNGVEGPSAARGNERGNECAFTGKVSPRVSNRGGKPVRNARRIRTQGVRMLGETAGARAAAVYSGSNARRPR